MAFQHFAGDARSAVAAAVQEEAEMEGRGLVQAEHLLLALASHPDLRHLGLDRDALATALAREEEESFAAVGVAAYDLPTSSATGSGSARLATSSKLAVARALKITAKRGQRRITAANLLLGILSAEKGRVPRALRLAGIDIGDLRARL